MNSGVQHNTVLNSLEMANCLSLRLKLNLCPRFSIKFAV